MSKNLRIGIGLLALVIGVGTAWYSICGGIRVPRRCVHGDHDRHHCRLPGSAATRYEREVVHDHVHPRASKSADCSSGLGHREHFCHADSARANPRLLIIARAGSEPAERRLTTAGATRVISPYRIAGRRIALAAIQPLLIDFSEGAPRGPNDTVNALAEVGIGDGSGTLEGHTVQDALEGFRSTTILGIERADGQLVVGPAADTQLQNGDR